DHFLTKPPGCDCGPGITGHTFQPSVSGIVPQDSLSEPAGGSWVSYTAVNRPRLDRFCNVHVFRPGRGRSSELQRPKPPHGRQQTGKHNYIGR
ncbi:MAG: hypothetical protein ACRC3B_17635, partial [Bacteroidia bacterium]